MRIVFETRGLCPVLGWGNGVGGRVWAKKKGSYSVHTCVVNECLKWRVSGSILFFFFLSFFTLFFVVEDVPYGGIYVPCIYWHAR